ncbi:MAG: aspartate/glutamate racemase family protein [Thermovenabulum sp.]|uniref:aspartate/glutamate racemase family protein n=1 Tax=Thermovenabulum sp. TaxID=3100335 RepID=UPI003C7BBA38
MKKIKVVVPVATSLWNESIRQVYETYKDRDTIIGIKNLDSGAEAIEQEYDEIWSELPTIKEAEKAQEENYDGVIIYCFNDPAVRAAKEKLNIPVVGLMEAAVSLAMLLGRKFSIITTTKRGIGTTEDLLKMYGFYEKCASIRAVEMDVLELSDIGKLEEMALKVSKIAIENDNADVLILGCGSMLGISESISKSLGIPVIEPGVAALKLCEDLIEIKTCQSKKAFPSPDEKIVRTN